MFGSKTILCAFLCAGIVSRTQRISMEAAELPLILSYSRNQPWIMPMKPMPARPMRTIAVAP
jgi:hypothetical protein